MAYDPNNIFARILRREIPAKTVYEDAHALAFHDINPQAPIHVLVIPKGAYLSAHDFCVNATDVELVGFWRAVARIADLLGIDAGGYRMLANHGLNAHQEVAHFHLHMFGGAALGPMLARKAR